MFALPVLMLKSGQPVLLDGTLVGLPGDLSTKYQIDWYAFHAKPGWNKCPQGFAVYVTQDTGGTKYILPGVLLEGETRPKRWKIYPRPIFFHRSQIEQFAKSIFNAGEQIQKEKDAEIRALIHDLRALSANIYHEAENAKAACESVGYTYARNRIETVLASQGMLSLRIDMLSYAMGDLAMEPELIPVFKKVDKVVRCFRPVAKDRGINLSLQGKSLSQIKGPNSFELIPYAIIDNAVKYAPDHSPIVVLVEETTNTITASVTSLGPFLEPAERTKIFESGYRGAHAIKSKQTGTGIGLATAKSLIARFNGKIRVDQEPSVETRNQDSYFSTTFVIEAPIERVRT